MVVWCDCSWIFPTGVGVPLWEVLKYVEGIVEGSGHIIIDWEAVGMVSAGAKNVGSKL